MQSQQQHKQQPHQRRSNMQYAMAQAHRPQTMTTTFTEPTMYDTKMSPKGGGGGGTRGGGGAGGSVAATAALSPASSSSSSQHSYFPKSHPTNKLVSSLSPPHPFAGGSPRTMKDRDAAAAAANGPTTPRMMMTMMKGPPPSPLSNPYKLARQSPLSAQKQQQPQNSRSTKNATNKKKNNYVNKNNSNRQHHHIQMEPYVRSTSHAGGPSPTATNSTNHDGGAHGSFRPDHNRSQHSTEQQQHEQQHKQSQHKQQQQHRAKPEPILTEQDRFDAYVNRFAQVDPRTSTLKTSKQHSQQQKQSQHFSSSSSSSLSPSSSSPIHHQQQQQDRVGNRVSPYSNNKEQQQQQRPVGNNSGTLSNVSVSSTTASTTSSSIALREKKTLMETKLATASPTSSSSSSTWRPQPSVSSSPTDEGGGGGGGGGGGEQRSSSHYHLSQPNLLPPPSSSTTTEPRRQQQHHRQLQQPQPEGPHAFSSPSPSTYNNKNKNKNYNRQLSAESTAATVSSSTSSIYKRKEAATAVATAAESEDATAQSARLQQHKQQQREEEESEMEIIPSSRTAVTTKPTTTRPTTRLLQRTITVADIGRASERAPGSVRQSRSLRPNTSPRDTNTTQQLPRDLSDRETPVTSQTKKVEETKEPLVLSPSSNPHHNDESPTQSSSYNNTSSSQPRATASVIPLSPPPSSSSHTHDTTTTTTQRGGRHSVLSPQTPQQQQHGTDRYATVNEKEDEEDDENDDKGNHLNKGHIISSYEDEEDENRLLPRDAPQRQGGGNDQRRRRRRSSKKSHTGPSSSSATNGHGSGSGGANGGSETSPRTPASSGGRGQPSPADPEPNSSSRSSNALPNESSQQSPHDSSSPISPGSHRRRWSVGSTFSHHQEAAVASPSPRTPGGADGGEEGPTTGHGRRDAAAAAMHDARSPGSDRTRDLANRFEQRMQSKGRSSQLKSAMISAYQQQQQAAGLASPSTPRSSNTTGVVLFNDPPEQEQQHPSGQSPMVVKARSMESGDADEKKEAEELMIMVAAAYKAAIETPSPANVKELKEKLLDSAAVYRAAIETPSPANVKELKEKLWDSHEALQVRVPPTLPYNGYESHRQHHDHRHHGDDTANHQGRTSSNDQVPTASAPSSRRAAAPSHHPAYRTSRSLSPKTSRNAYETNTAQSLTRASLSPHRRHSVPTEEDATTYQQQKQPERTTSDVASSTGSAGSGHGHRFKSKFYEAAALASPQWSLPGGAPSGGGNRSDSSLEDKPLGATAVVQPTFNFHPANKSSWMETGDAVSEAPYSQASTPKISNSDHNISVLLRKLHSINRQDPSQALAEIDEILKEEALKDDPTLLRALRVTDEEYTRKMQQGERPSPVSNTNDDDSDSETTVSSITNPTYQGHQQTKNTDSSTPSALDEPALELPSFDDEPKAAIGPVSLTRQASPTASAATSHLRRSSWQGISSSDSRGMMATFGVSGQIHEGSPGSEGLSRVMNAKSRPPLPPPPDTITTKDRSPKKEEAKSNTGGSQQQPLIEEKQQPLGLSEHPERKNLSHTYVGQSTAGERLVLGDPHSSNSEDLALKIRRWDRLSGKDSSTARRSNRQANGGEEEDLVPNAAEDLRSIVSPHEQQGQSNKVRQLSPLLRDTSMSHAEGVEVVETIAAASPVLTPAGDGRDNPVRTSPSNRAKSMNLSNDFDDAWVTLPTSRIFPSPERSNKSPQRPSMSSSNRASSLGRSPGRRRPSPGRSPGRRRPSPGRSPGRRRPSPGRSPGRRRPSPRRGSDGTNSRVEAGKASGAVDQEGTNRQQAQYDVENVEDTTDESGENKKSKPKGRLRALLQRGKNEESQGQTSTSVTTGSIATSTRRSHAQSELDGPAPQSRRNSNRGRSDQEKMETNRSRSLEERRVRNPNIARKFSRMLKVYGEDERA